MRILFNAILFLTTLNLLSQNYTISGKIKDNSNGEILVGATVRIEGAGGAFSNEYGFYSLTVPKGIYIVQVRYLGYETVEKKIDVKTNITYNVELEPKVKSIGEAVVSAKAQERAVENKKISVVKIEAAKIKEIPVIFGEVDILKTITLLPGIQTGGEGNSGFNVRGGSQDQNLILLDEATVYNASHLLGFFSVFNGDAVRDLELYKGGMPAKYGGRLSSIVDIKMKDGNNKKYAATGGIGTISSRLTLEGPIQKDKASFMVAGRRSYADIFLPLAQTDLARESQLYFYDLNLKANYEISDKDRLYVSGYFGRDVLGLGSLFGLNWGNATATLRWNRVVNQKLFMNTSLIYSDFYYGFNISFAENASFKLDQSITDLYIKSDWSYFLNQENKFTFGGQAINHYFNPGRFSPTNEESRVIFDETQIEERRALETGLYVDHEYKPNKRFNMRYGLRLSSFSNIGGTEFSYVKDGVFRPIPELTDSTVYSGTYNTYWGLEPRLSLSYNLKSDLAVKSSYNRTFQYIQQATNTASAFPTDQWFSANKNIQPQRADQIAVGLFKNFEKFFEASFETYYKWLNNQFDYRDNARLIFNPNLDGELLFGDGWAYGAEFYLARTQGKTTGFMSYTLSRTMRQINGINFDQPFVANFDRPHNLNLVLTHKFNDRILISASYVFLSGQPLTAPQSKFFFDGAWQTNYSGKRNEFRIPSYQRADLGITIKSKEKPDKRFKSDWNISVYNLTNRDNPFAIYFREIIESDLSNFENVQVGQTAAIQTTLFRIIPAITWNFAF